MTMTVANPGRHDDNVWRPDMHQQEEQVQTDRAAPSLPCQLDGPFLITISAQTANCRLPARPNNLSGAGL